MGYNCVVLAKQVPDTHRITGQVMKDDGTVDRAALPAIFNPEDLNALELALQIKDRHGGRVTVITMGPPGAVRILREALYRGADDAILLTDPRGAASDTLATSYILSRAVRKLDHDIVLCGRQAIDGDTAQVGPQLAEKLGVTQITYVEALESLAGQTLTARRNLGNGWQRVKARLPVLLTVTGDANTPRVAAARKMMKYKNAHTRAEIEQQIKATDPTADDSMVRKLVQEQAGALERQGLLIRQWNLDDLQADLAWCGRNGSPTKVHRVQSVVLAAKESKDVAPTDDGIAGLVHELIQDKIIA
ncbi:MAG: electron transfer flavoprotein subunit beta/FixA family protein [Planctomycetes bacterium]|nr:electron transfer flavoprotein subunit beta/FixA family protein [Planctomycetota bacterium]